MKIHDAALEGDLVELKHILKQGNAGINAPDDSGFLALHLAVRSGHFEAAKLLLEGGSSSEDNNNDDFISPLQLAYVVGEEDLIQLLWRFSEELVEPPPPAPAPCTPSSPVPQPQVTSPFSPTRPKLPSSGGVNSLECDVEQHSLWDKVPRGHWEYWTVNCDGQAEELTVSLQLQVGRAYPGLQLSLKHATSPTAEDPGTRSADPDSRGLLSVTIENPECGEWIVGVTSAAGDLYRGPIGLLLSFGSSGGPDWISDLYAQCDTENKGFVEQDEMLMFCQFANPKVKEETIKASFDGFGHRLDAATFKRWALENEGMINPETTTTTPKHSFAASSGSGMPQMGESGGDSRASLGNTTPVGTGSISRICMNLPCFSISDTVLTPIK